MTDRAVSTHGTTSTSTPKSTTELQNNHVALTILSALKLNHSANNSNSSSNNQSELRALVSKYNEPARELLSLHFSHHPDIREGPEFRSQAKIIATHAYQKQNQIVSKIKARQLDYEAFVCTYMFPNWPVVIQHFDGDVNDYRDPNSENNSANVHLLPLVTDHWIMVKPKAETGDPGHDQDHRAEINQKFMANEYGADIVPVKRLKRDTRSHSAACNEFLALSLDEEVVDEKQVSLADWINQRMMEDPDLYLKDWHFVLKHPDAELYDVPEWFQDDWLDTFYNKYRKPRDDFRFVYMGGKDSVTPYHTDVLNSYSWSTNVVGIKEWIFEIPEGQRDRVRDWERLESHEDDVRFVPPRYIIIIQREHETVFVPSQWQHRVRNLVDTLSINHNWLNGANVLALQECIMTELDGLEDNLAKFGVLESVDTDHKNTLLRACCGMDLDDLCIMCMDEIVHHLDVIREAESSEFRRSVALAFVYTAKQVLQKVVNKQSDSESISEAGAIAKEFLVELDSLVCDCEPQGCTPCSMMYKE